MRYWIISAFPFALLCLACDQLAASEIPELSWDDLVPADYQPDTVFGDLDISNLSDGDPRAKIAMEKLKKLWENAPVVKSFTGQRVRLPGFAIPLETDTKTAKSFILVPYYGACIHVPPPPSNHIVLVNAPFGAHIEEAFDTVMVEGTLTAGAITTDTAHAGYTMTAISVEPYKD